MNASAQLIGSALVIADDCSRRSAADNDVKNDLDPSIQPWVATPSTIIPPKTSSRLGEEHTRMEAGLTGSSLVGVWDGLPIRCGTGVDQSIGSGANGLDFSPFPGTPV